MGCGFIKESDEHYELTSTLKKTHTQTFIGILQKTVTLSCEQY